MSRFRLATFNILFAHEDEGPGSWGERRPLICRALSETRADILGLQEVLPPRLSDVAEDVGDLTLIPGPVNGAPRWAEVSLAAEFVLRTVRTRRVPRSIRELRTRSQRLVSGEHQPIAYRADRFLLRGTGAFWISSSPERPRSMLPLALTPFLVHWARFESREGLGHLLVLNAHFGHAPWHHAATARIVSAQIEALARRDEGFDESGVFCVVFEAPAGAVGLYAQKTRFGIDVSRYLVDAARAAGEKFGPPVTFHWGRGSTRLGFTLDYVLARSTLSPSRVEVLDVHQGSTYPSDHHPLVVEFEEPLGA